MLVSARVSYDEGLLGGSWAVISGVVSRVTIVMLPYEGIWNPTYKYP